MHIPSDEWNRLSSELSNGETQGEYYLRAKAPADVPGAQKTWIQVTLKGQDKVHLAAATKERPMICGNAMQATIRFYSGTLVNVEDAKAILKEAKAQKESGLLKLTDGWSLHNWVEPRCKEKNAPR